MVKQVKILLSRELYNEYDDIYSRSILQDGISDWEEISDEDYDFLRRNLYMLSNLYTKEYNLSPVLIVKDERPVFDRIQSIKEYINQEKQKEAKRKAEEERKKAEKAKKRMMKQTADERALFEQLKEKFKE